VLIERRRLGAQTRRGGYGVGWRAGRDSFGDVAGERERRMSTQSWRTRLGVAMAAPLAARLGGVDSMSCTAALDKYDLG